MQDIALCDGAPFRMGGGTALCQGGIVTPPRVFANAGGDWGLMRSVAGSNHAKLRQRADASVGCTKVAEAKGPTVVMNYRHQPDVQGFQRVQSQIAAQLSVQLSSGIETAK